MKKHLTMIDDDTQAGFIRKVEEFLNSHKVISTKWQRNLYYSLSGSTGTDKVAQPRSCQEDKTSLCQNYLAFIVWEVEGEEHAAR